MRPHHGRPRAHSTGWHVVRGIVRAVVLLIACALAAAVLSLEAAPWTT